MGKAVVTTPDALEGISAADQDHLLVAASAGEFSRQVLSCLNGNHPDLGLRARKFVVENYSWNAKLKSLDHIIDGLLHVGHSP